MKVHSLRLSALLVFSALLPAQVYSPKLLRQGQPDPTDLKAFAETIFASAAAHTPSEKAKAIWRFFLTDGRFVEPGFWYHIAGWTYEEPAGEVLDPLKLINSYGFGLCYHIAPLLEAVYKAGGFADARTWFLTGHTVAEVFYDGHYHYYDSDMMGYNIAGDGHFFGKPVVGVRDLERDGNIILGKMRAPDRVNPEAVDTPWYPADVREHAMGDLASLFTTTADNYLYLYTRYANGHSMDFVLRSGEKLIRLFQPEEPGLFYLPFRYDGKQWTEFPREFSEYAIRTQDGPRSQKDARSWATGRIEYTPASLPSDDVVIIEMPSPYVIIDARFTFRIQLPSPSAALRVETSTNGGATWDQAGSVAGPYQGEWQAEPKVLVKSAHGRFTAVSGSYGYLVRITKKGGSEPQIDSSRLVSRIQLNPRALPAVQDGENQFDYTARPPIRRIAQAAPLSTAPVNGLRLVEENGQSFLLPASEKRGEVLYALDAAGSPLTGFDVGARFLDLRNRLAPDKLTAETRPTAVTTMDGDTSIEWSVSPQGPFEKIYQSSATLSSAQLQWLDGDPVDRLLVWPEVFRKVSNLPAGTKRVYVRIGSSGPAIDNIRLAVYARAAEPSGVLEITQTWRENGVSREHKEVVPAEVGDHHFTFRAGSGVQNESVTLSLARPRSRQHAGR